MAGYLFGGTTGETAESLARKRAVAEALLANANSRVPQNIGEGISAIGQALSGRLGLNALQKKQDAGSAALDAKIKGYWGGGAATGSSMPKVDAAGNVALPSSSGDLPSSFIAAVDRTEGAGDYDTLFGHAQKDGPFAGTSVSSMPIKDVLAFTDPSGPYAQFVKGKVGRVATPVGKYQTVGTTLRGAVDALGLDPTAPYDKATQDRVASYLARQRIASADTLPGKISALRSEWEGFKNVPDSEMAKIVADVQSAPSAGTEVASLDPSIGMPTASPIQPPPVNPPPAPPTPGYVDPVVTTEGRAPMPVQNPPQGQQPSPAVVAALGATNNVAPAPPSPVATALAGQPAEPGAPLPPLPSRDVAPAPTVAAVPEQRSTVVAQALLGQQTPPPPPGRVDPRYLEILSDPYVTPGQAAMVRSMMQQDQARQEAAYDAWLKQNDPAYRLNIAKTEAELDNLRNPKISPADQAKIDFDRQKFETDQQNRNSMTASEKAADERARQQMLLEREKFEAEQKAGQWEKMTDGRLYNKNSGEFRDAPPPIPGSVLPKFDDVSSLRKEIQQLPSYKNLSQALPIYRSMAETAGRNSKASDLNLVYGLGKIMDPTSVVREGEMVMVKNTASLPDWFQGAIASLNGGAALTPETREAIMKEAFGRVQGYDQAFKQDATQYSGIVERNKFNPSDVIPDFGSYVPWNPNPDAKTPAADIGPSPEGVPADVWGAMTPAERKLWQK
ncbi:hypothetical protein HX900_17460 [Rhizobium sp. WYCCWR 11290]|uniref:Uncharacterized protein n=1 Tax=Rhizobium changzhiense TaxID=2692317 RepID=A0A7Z0U9G6_9HYPH|nr:hypothetical protein [Rhizobium changzhiense]NZD62894.1 hypothetical protein [Rhizobium changzhiense]